MELSRRGFIHGISSSLVILSAPAIVSASSLMPVRVIEPWFEETTWRVDNAYTRGWMQVDAPSLKPLSWFLEKYPELRQGAHLVGSYGDM